MAALGSPLQRSSSSSAAAMAHAACWSELRARSQPSPHGARPLALLAAGGVAIETTVDAARCSEMVRGALEAMDAPPAQFPVPLVADAPLRLTMRALEHALAGRDAEASAVVDNYPFFEPYALAAAASYLDIPPLLRLHLQRTTALIASALEPSSSSEQRNEQLRRRFAIPDDDLAGRLGRVLRTPRRELNDNLLPEELDESPLTSEGPPWAAAGLPEEAPCALGLLPGGDDLLEAAFAACSYRTLARAKLLCRSWRRAARRVMCAEEWQVANLTLGELIAAGAAPDAVRRRVEERPAEVGRRGRDGHVPLHALLRSPSRALLADEALVGAMLEAHPRSAQERSPDGLTALHLAALAGAPVPVLEALLAHFPIGASRKVQVWRDGELPMLERMLRPAAQLEHRAGVGQLPLHAAAAGPAPRDLVDYLLGLHPAGASAEDSCGRLPLHCAAIGAAPVATVDALLAAHPEGAAHADKQGARPIDLALRHRPAERALLVRLRDACAELKRAAIGSYQL